LQKMVNNCPQTKHTAQLQAMAGNYSAQSKISTNVAPQGVVDGTDNGETAQLAFAGPQFAAGANDNTNYGGPGFQTGAAKANTGCGSCNEILTDGVGLNGAGSNPGNPAGFALYRDNWSRGGGLVKDKDRPQASTRMHLINHRLENSGNTQGNANNIFLGTATSNNPRHLHDVENHVIGALWNHRSLQNAAYEAAMGNAQSMDDPQGNSALYWTNDQAPGANAVNQNDLTNVYVTGMDFLSVADADNPATGVALGYGVGMDGYSGLRHLWLKYSVRPNYTGVPAHVMAGIDSNLGVETAWANGLGDEPKAAKLALTADFSNNFAPNAFPATFTNTVWYYSASYNTNNKYSKESETLTLGADL